MSSVAPRKFVAFTECPDCNALDFHAVDTPPEVDPMFIDKPGVDSFIDMDEEPDRIEIWGGKTFMTIPRESATVWRVDKSTCDCIRTCSKCGAQWGEK